VRVRKFLPSARPECQAGNFASLACCSVRCPQRKRPWERLRWDSARYNRVQSEPQIDTDLHGRFNQETRNAGGRDRPQADRTESTEWNKCIETRSAPALAHRYPRDFTFYLGNPFSSILKILFILSKTLRDLCVLCAVVSVVPSGSAPTQAFGTKLAARTREITREAEQVSEWERTNQTPL
jgi:hypothetical protein